MGTAISTIMGNYEPSSDVSHEPNFGHPSSRKGGAKGCKCRSARDILDVSGMKLQNPFSIMVHIPHLLY